jgi:plasmid stabilization system protein ParE
MTNLVVSEDADADLGEILAYLEREAGPRVAESYGRKIGECLALGTDTRIGIVRPCILIYDYTAATDTLTLLRIVHGKRNITARLIRR